MLLAILLFGQKPMHWWSRSSPARARPTVRAERLLVTLGLAALTEGAGLSLALGAFLAGI